MKKHIILLMLFLSPVRITFAACADPDSTAEVTTPWSSGLEMAATDKYLWRGMTINEGFIVQPLAWMTYQNWTLSLWSSLTLSEPSDDIKRPELDATVTYEFNLLNFSVESYFSYYHYIDQPDVPNTGELGTAIGYPIGNIMLSTGVIVDVLEYPGAVYLEQKIEAEKEFNDRITASGALTLGSGLQKFNEAYFELPKSTTSIVTVEGKLIYSFPNGLYLQPYFQFNKTIHNDLKVYLKKHTGCFGLAVGTEF